MDRAVPTKTGSSNLYSEIFERSGDAVFVVDPVDETFIEVNARACDMLGYDYSALMKIGPLGVHSHEMNLWRKRLAAALRDKSIFTTELSCRTASGDLLPTEVTTTAIEFGSRQCVIFAVRDLTPRLLIQEAL